MKTICALMQRLADWLREGRIADLTAQLRTAAPDAKLGLWSRLCDEVSQRSAGQVERMQRTGKRSS